MPVMASTHSDSMALRPSIEVPSDPHAVPKELSKRHTRGMAISLPEVRMEQDHATALSREGHPSHEKCDGNHDETDRTITLSSTSKLAGQTVAPFLAKHIPDQYNPLGPPPTTSPAPKNPNTKFCYRHRPDTKCRRTADEPTMEKLQTALETLSPSDQQGISHVWSLFSAAPAKHRDLMLQGILTQCCFPQLSYLSGAVRDLIRIDFVTALPSEISYKILCYLDTTSLCKAAQVSQRWRLLADDDVVWHKMCEQHIDRKCTKCGWGLPLLERKRLRDWKRQQQLRATGRGLNQWSPNLTPVPDENGANAFIPASSLNHPSKRSADSISSDDTSLIVSPESSKRQCTGPQDSYFPQPKFRPWKDVYKDRFKVGTNWRYGRATIKHFKGHSNGVMCLQFDDNILATGSYDNTIRIWDIRTGECVKILQGHTSGVRALKFDETKLISGSLDATVKVWNWRTGELIKTYPGHTKGVITVDFTSKYIASGSIDKTIKIRYREKGIMCSLKEHKDWVNDVKIDEASDTLFSASDDCTVMLWDLENPTAKPLRTFDGHVGQVQKVILLPADYEPDDEVVEELDDSTSSAASSTDLREAIADLETFSHWPSTRPKPPRYMLTSALDSTIRLWDVHTGRSIKTFFGHVEGVWCVAGDTLRVVSGGQDNMTKVWDARTGKCERTFLGHTGPVTSIGLSDSRMCTGSEDADVRMYNFVPQEDGEDWARGEIAPAFIDATD